jgi:hypothetical protein
MWLIPDTLHAPTFVVLMAAIHAYAPEPQKILSRIGIAFGVAYAVVISADYLGQSRSSCRVC